MQRERDKLLLSSFNGDGKKMLRLSCLKMETREKDTDGVGKQRQRERKTMLYWVWSSCGSYQKVEKVETKPQKRECALRREREREGPDVG